MSIEERSYKKGDCIAYNSKNENYILSNMYCCKLVVSNNVFYGVDCYYFYKLAELYEDNKLTTDLLTKLKVPSNEKL